MTPGRASASARRGGDPAPDARPGAVLLGGTFDPFHRGHVAIAEQAQRLLRAAEVWLIPARVPPHRPRTDAAAPDRLAMAAAVAAARPGWRVLDLEMRRDGPSFTRDSIAALLAERPGFEQWFLLGADAAREIRSWHRLDDLLEIARFVLVNRSGTRRLTREEAVGLGFMPRRTRILHVDSPMVSATDIRGRLRCGEPLEGLVPLEVARVIAERGLYGAEPGAVRSAGAAAGGEG